MRFEYVWATVVSSAMSGLKRERIAVVEGSLRKLNAGAFLELASLCGLDLRELDLAQMARRRLVAPYEDADGTSYYTALHLLVMAQYCRAISPMRHPWGTRPSDQTLDEVSWLGQRLNEVLVAAWRGDVEGAASAQDMDGFFRSLEDFLARIDPFGPLGEVFDLLQPSFVERVRNSGRLYLELRRAGGALSQLLDTGVGHDEEPLTQPMFGVEEVGFEAVEDLRSTQVIDSEGGGTSSAARSAMDSVFDAAVASGQEELARPGSASGRQTQPIEREPVEMQVVELELDEISEEGLLAEESSEPILLAETQVEEKPSAPPQLPPEVVKTPEQRIAELNRLREQYLRERAWVDLVRLYEDGMELFQEALERQQVHLVLGMLYETKLNDMRGAFDAFLLAWEIRDGEQGRQKALEGLGRLSALGELRDEFIGWAEGQLVQELTLRERDELRRALYQALLGGEQYQRAFLTYAALLTDEPDRKLTEEALEELGRLGEFVGMSEVREVLADLMEEELEEETRERVLDFLRGSTG